jgi:hypothetical protein
MIRKNGTFMKIPDHIKNNIMLVLDFYDTLPKVQNMIGLGMLLITMLTISYKRRNISGIVVNGYYMLCGFLMRSRLEDNKNI